MLRSWSSEGCLGSELALGDSHRGEAACSDLGPVQEEGAQQEPGGAVQQRGAGPRRVPQHRPCPQKPRLHNSRSSCCRRGAAEGSSPLTAHPKMLTPSAKDAVPRHRLRIHVLKSALRKPSIPIQAQQQSALEHPVSRRLLLQVRRKQGSDLLSPGPMAPGHPQGRTEAGWSS